MKTKIRKQSVRKFVSVRGSLMAMRAFTLTEVIVVVGVMMLLLSVGVGYTQKGGKQIVLFREHAQLTEQILRARSFATQKLRPEDELVCGYGIAILSGTLSQSQYALFKDLPSGGCPGNGTMDSGEDLETFTLDKAVRIFESNHSDFVFSPRDGFVYFGQNRARPDQDPVRITLELKDANQRLTISVNYIGQVYTK
ncbi:MAG: hypothetical protein Q7R62_00125 [bacterium]|nr:hypothetical protein [bacterium]